MKKAKVFFKNIFSGILEEREKGRSYIFRYDDKYIGPAISLTLPRWHLHEFNSLPAFFEGLLPEGVQLEALLRENKIDRGDLFAQLLAVGQDTVGAVTIVEDVA